MTESDAKRYEKVIYKIIKVSNFTTTCTCNRKKNEILWLLC